MSKVTGVVDWAGENKFGGHSIRIDGNYYNSKFPIKCEVGDNVEFDSGTTGKYCNKLRVLSSGGSKPAPTPSGGRRGSFPIDKADGQRSIIRQNALARAVELVALFPDGIEDRTSAAAEAVRIAIELEKFTSGDLDEEADNEAKAALTGS